MVRILLVLSISELVPEIAGNRCCLLVRVQHIIFRNYSSVNDYKRIVSLCYRLYYISPGKINLKTMATSIIYFSAAINSVKSKKEIQNHIFITMRIEPLLCKYKFSKGYKMNIIEAPIKMNYGFFSAAHLT